MPTPYVLNSPEARDQFTRMVLTYRGAEENLIRLLAEAIRRGVIGDQKFYRGQLTLTRWLRQETQRILDEMNGVVDGGVQTMLVHEYQHTAILAAGTPLAQGVSGGAVMAVAGETVAMSKQSSLPVLRAVEDTYRRIAAQGVVDRITSGQVRVDAIQQMVNRFADSGIRVFKDSAGRRWSLDSYTEMVLRTGVNRAQNLGRRDGFREAGIELIRVSSHHACAPQCLPYQGKILAITGPAGPRIVDGETVHVTATFDGAVARGYHHPNCRHVDTAFFPGMPEPEVIPSDREDYELAQRQRQIERNIRRWKLREAGALTEGEARKARLKVRQWQAEQREHIKQRPWLVRQYDREKAILAQR